MIAIHRYNRSDSSKVVVITGASAASAERLPARTGRAARARALDCAWS
jgi:hypothetical protein